MCAVEMAVFFKVDSSRFRSAIPPKPGTFKTTLGLSVYSKIVVLMRRFDEVLNRFGFSRETAPGEGPETPDCR